jgi:hypothetical protein
MLWSNCQARKKGRKWTAIGYTDEETGDVITGWVFNRYLEKFKKQI